MSINEIARGEAIARARIHIERFNERLKQFEFLKGPISHWRYCILEEAIYVCSFLANFSQLLAE